MTRMRGLSLAIEATYSGGGDVREVGSNTRGVDNIVEGQLIDMRAGLEEKRQWLEWS